VFIYQELAARAAASKPVRVGLIGAGKFGSMFLSQVPTTHGLVVAQIADLDPGKAKATCRGVGWDSELIQQTTFTDDAVQMMQSGGIDVIVEATGNPVVGFHHAREAIRNGLHIVMVNVEADVLVGGLLAEEARRAGVVYSMAYGNCRREQGRIGRKRPKGESVSKSR
jgi:predicted homoserine dehydrogenase-like protein